MRQTNKVHLLSDTSFYAKRDIDLIFIHQNIVKNMISDLVAKQELLATAKNIIIKTPRTSCIYFLLKTHKPNLSGRLIVSTCSCPTERISSHLDKNMAPMVKNLLSYIKDSQHALESFRDFYFPGQNKLIFIWILHGYYSHSQWQRPAGPQTFFRSTHC